jgi:hypothetical protein
LEAVFRHYEIALLGQPFSEMSGLTIRFGYLYGGIKYYQQDKKMKVCNKCQEKKSSFEFYETAKGKYGRDAVCKKCRQKQNRARIQKKREADASLLGNENMKNLTMLDNRTPTP